MMLARETWSVVRLALADFLVEWRLSLCFVLALAAVLSPLFILFGLKYGLVATITKPIIENPQYRQIIPIGAGRFTEEWFEQMRRNPSVGFVVPRTRTIAANIFVRNLQAREIPSVNASLIPSAGNDPVIPSYSFAEADPSSVVLSSALADKLGVKPGDELEGSVTRTMDERPERAVVTLKILGVAPESAFDQYGVFAPLGLLLAVEDYRDGREVPMFGWEGNPAQDGPREYASYRLFAATLGDVALLRELLRKQGLEVRTRASEIDTMRSLDRNLSFIFWVIAAIGGTGYLLSLGASLWAHVERKRRELSILRLMGVRIPGLVWFPISNALFTSLLGALVAVAAALAIAAVLNDVFVTSGAPGEFACRLLPEHLLMGVGITLFSALLSSLLAAYRSTLIDPAEGLREV